MPNIRFRNQHPPGDPVARACDITRSLFNAARGNYATDAQTIDAIARQSELRPAVVRRFLLPSRRPNDVSLGIWGRLVAAYRRQLQRQLSALETEIVRLEHLDPSGRAVLDLLDEAESLASKIRSLAESLHSDIEE